MPENLEFKATSSRGDKDIWATFIRVATHFDQPGNEQDTGYLSFLVPRDGSPVSIGCEYDNGQTQGYDKFTYAIANACFTDAPNCQAPSQTSRVPHDCSAGCKPPLCIAQALDKSNPAEAAVIKQIVSARVQLSNANYSGTPSLSALLGGSTCLNRKTTFPDTKKHDLLEDQGDLCRFPLAIRNTSTIAGVLITIGTDVSGLRIVGNTVKLTIFVPSDVQSQGITLEYFDNNKKSLGYEHVSSVEFLPKGIRITGDRHYCIWLTFDEESQGISKQP